MDIKEVAKEIRGILKKEFPATKFSVTISRFSMGSSADVSWTDGPTTDQVDELIGGYGNDRSRFINTSRAYSHELAHKAIKFWKEQNPQYAHITVYVKEDGGCYTEFDPIEFKNGFGDLRPLEDSLDKVIFGYAFDGTNLICPQEDADDCEAGIVSTPEPEVVEVATETTPQPQLNHLDSTFDYVVAVYNSYFCLECKNDEPEYFTLDKWQKTVGQYDSLTAEAYGCFTSWNSSLERMTITAICCNLPQVETPQPQQNQLDMVEADILEVDRQQAYQKYLASQQEADALEAKLAVKKTETQVYFAIMKEIDEKIQAKKREAEVVTTAQTQSDFDVRTLESKKVTLILINTMGCPVCRHITVIAADIVSAKRYHGEMTDKKCLELQYLEKGKRKPRSTRYTEADLAITLGWQDIKVPTNNGYIDAFDSGLLEEMVRQAKDVVYIQQAGQASTVTMIDRFCIN